MAKEITIEKVKRFLRIRHTQLDEEVADDIDECLADLVSVGVVYPDENDPLILAAVKNHAKASFVEDARESAEFLSRYEKQKASLMMAEGYGGDHV